MFVTRQSVYKCSDRNIGELLSAIVSVTAAIRISMLS